MFSFIFLVIVSGNPHEEFNACYQNVTRTTTTTDPTTGLHDRKLFCTAEYIHYQDKWPLFQFECQSTIPNVTYYNESSEVPLPVL